MRGVARSHKLAPSKLEPSNLDPLKPFFFPSRLFYRLGCYSLGLGAVLNLAVAAAPSALAQLPPPPTAVDFSASPSGASPLYPCAAPRPNQSVLLILSHSTADQDRIRQVLPAATRFQVCTYQNTPVTYVDGFTQISDAQAFGKQVTDVTGIATVVAKASSAMAATPQPDLVPPTYNPQPLAAGYAVLVDFANRPELATQVQSTLGRSVALVSYAQRPYLLAIHTGDPNLATATAQDLAGRGFSAAVVDSRQVLVLRPAIAVAP